MSHGGVRGLNRQNNIPTIKTLQKGGENGTKDGNQNT